MAKKKDRIINHIDQLNVEIDYDKLADAIVKANEKQGQQYSASREWMKFLIYPVFWGVAIITGLLAIGFFIYGAVSIKEILDTAIRNVDWKQLATSILLIGVSFFLVAVCVATGITAKEINEESDREYVATMFSNMVALVALVISLIALAKG